MTELDMLCEWNKMPLSQRAALIAALPLGSIVESRMHWNQINETDRKALMALDWNFMLGGKLGKRE